MLFKICFCAAFLCVTGVLNQCLVMAVDRGDLLNSLAWFPTLQKINTHLYQIQIIWEHVMFFQSCVSVLKKMKYGPVSKLLH